ncbi:unnamed protein product [Auanema sp. JU1783]|nr:unnamed protein product [Auanema sp. JU1783]
MRLNGSSASSASVASRLYGTRSRRDSLGSDPELISFSDQEMQESYLSREMSSISKQMQEMQEKQQLGDDERTRLKMENALLTERLHVLEEQLQATEQRYKDQLHEEKLRAKELLSRSEREKQLESESLTLKYQMIEKDLLISKREAEKAREEVKKFKEQSEELKADLDDSRLTIEDLEDERIKMERQFRKFKEEAKQDIDSSSEMVEALTMQTEELRKRAGGVRQGSMAEQMLDLEEELEEARVTIRNLKKERDDLQNQMLAESVERGHNLLADTPCLADELIGGDSSQLLEALREQEVCNQKLRVYINGILMRVIERHPEILEVGSHESDSSS